MFKHIGSGCISIFLHSKPIYKKACENEFIIFHTPALRKLCFFRISVYLSILSIPWLNY